MTKEQYNEWRNHPATLFFRKFIKERRDSMIHAVTQEWINSGKSSEEARGRILELFDVEDVSFEVIETFYQEKENAAKIGEAVPR